MKLWLDNETHARAKACAKRVDMPLRKWCHLACVGYMDTAVLAECVSVAKRDACTLATIDGECEPKLAAVCILMGVEFVEVQNKRVQSWVGGSPSEELAKSDEMKTAVELANKLKAKRMRKREKEAV
jgi:hypothetical protein